MNEWTGGSALAVSGQLVSPSSGLTPKWKSPRPVLVPFRRLCAAVAVLSSSLWPGQALTHCSLGESFSLLSHRPQVPFPPFHHSIHISLQPLLHQISSPACTHNTTHSLPKHYILPFPILSHHILPPRNISASLRPSLALVAQ